MLQLAPATFSQRDRDNWLSLPHQPIFTSLGCKTSARPAGPADKDPAPYSDLMISDGDVTNAGNVRGKNKEV